MAKKAGVSFAFFCAFMMLVVFCLVQVSSPTAANAGVNKQAKKAFENGDFYNSIKILSVELRKKPDHQDNINLMEEVIPLFFDKNKRDAEKSVRRKKWDEAVQQYNRIIEIDDLLSEIPPVPKKVDGQKEKVPTTFELPEDLYEQYENAQSMAIETHYTKAQNYESENSYKDAAIEYRLTREYDQNFKDCAIRYKECREKAMLKIAVMPFEDGTNSSYGALGDLITQQVIAEAMSLNPEFLQFVTRDYLDQMLTDQGEISGGTFTTAEATKFGKKLGVHAFVFGKLMSIIEDFPGVIESAGSNEYRTTRNKQPVVYRCTYTVHKREGNAKVLGSFQIVDGATGIIKNSGNLSNSAGDFTSWVTFRGNEEAIPYEIKEQNLENRALTSAGELVTEAINDMGSEFARQLVETFK